MKVVSRQWSVLSKSAVSAVFCIMLFAIRVSAQAQQPKKIAKIGYLATSSPEATAASVEAFRQALRANGWVEGQNVTIDYRYAEGNPDRLREYAVELVRSNVDVVLVNGLGAAGTAMEATKTIPIVVANAADPVAAGLVTSLARPGGNLTGVSNRVIELGGKRLEVLKETFPKLVRVAVLRSPGGLRLELKEMQAAAPSLKIQLQILEVRVADDFEKVFQAAVKARVGALAVNADPTGFFTSNRKLIVDLVQKKRLPAIYNQAVL